MKRKTGTSNRGSPSARTWAETKRSLRRLFALLFIGTMVAMLLIELLFYAYGDIGRSQFLISMGVYSVLIVLLILGTYFYVKEAWLRVYVSRSQLLSIWDISTHAVFAIDGDSFITSWSQGAERIFGHREDEVLGNELSALLPADAPHSQEEMLDTLRRGGPVEQYRATYRRKGGDLFAAEVSASPLELPNTSRGGLVLVLRDVSGQLEMEDRAKESEVRYRNLFESSVDGIVAFDQDGRIIESNQTFADMVGYTRGELQSKTNLELTPPGWRSVDEDIVRNQIMRTGRSDEYMKEYIRRDGSVIPVSIRAWQITDGEGKPAGIWANIKDISERRQYENFIRDTIIRLEEANEQLRDLDRLKVEFVAMVTHELRSPLGTIQSSLSALRAIGGGDGAPETGELMNILERGVHRLSRLIEDLLDITRIESGQLSLRSEVADPTALAASVVETIRPRFVEKGLALSFKPPDEPCMAEFDPGRIEQVLENLLDNALKYTTRGGVKVRVDCTRTQVIFAISDTGLGIAPEKQQKIFEKFWTINTVRSNGTPSIGLGLAICKGIVEAGGGNIWVESREDVGSTFSFDVPRVTDFDES